MTARKGFTLLEMILVLAVITAISALAYPTISGWFRGETLRTAADSVRAAIAMARHLAIEEGQPYRLAIVEGSGNLRAAPDLDEAWFGSIDPTTEFEETLPRGVILELDTGLPLEAIDLGDKETFQEKGQVSPTSWTTVATFFPDGHADQDVRLICQGFGITPVVIQLRALTGTSTVVKDP